MPTIRGNRVYFSKSDVEHFKSRWPASGLPSKSLWFEMDSTGDLVDIGPGDTSRFDGPALLALSDDAKEILRKKSNPGRKHLSGHVSAKAQRAYEDILASERRYGRYKGREKEVAARTVRGMISKGKLNPPEYLESDSAYNAGELMAEMYNSIRVRPGRETFLSGFNKWFNKWKHMGVTGSKANALQSFEAGFRAKYRLGNPSQVHNLLELLKGSNVMGTSAQDELGNYHHAKAAVDAGRIRDEYKRLGAVKKALHGNRVTVSLNSDGSVRVYNPEKNMEVSIGRKHNPSEAESISEGFHGRPPSETIDIDEEEQYTEELGVLGCLVELHITRDDGETSVKLRFPIPTDPKFEDGDEVYLAAPNKHQMEFVGGDQEIANIDEIAKHTDKQLVKLGCLDKIVYLTDKYHLQDSDGKEAEYVHELGKKKMFGFSKKRTGRPEVIYDTVNQQLKLVGGTYSITDEGIIN